MVAFSCTALGENHHACFFAGEAQRGNNYSWSSAGEAPGQDHQSWSSVGEALLDVIGARS